MIDLQKPVIEELSEIANARGLGFETRTVVKYPGQFIGGEAPFEAEWAVLRKNHRRVVVHNLMQADEVPEKDKGLAVEVFYALPSSNNIMSLRIRHDGSFYASHPEVYSTDYSQAFERVLDMMQSKKV